jgi:hypothetical protein
MQNLLCARLESQGREVVEKKSEISLSLQKYKMNGNLTQKEHAFTGFIQA